MSRKIANIIPLISHFTFSIHLRNLITVFK